MRVGIKVLIGIGLVIAGVIIWFRLPYSPLKHTFIQKVEKEKAQLSQDPTVYFTKSSVSHLPEAIRKYIELCGYMGKPKMKFTEVICKQTAFGMSVGKPTIVIDYYYYNFTKGFKRYAYIKSWMFGIPFEGLDEYEHEKGAMKGMFGKALTLFDSRGKEMNQAALVTLLAEAMITPGWFLDERLTFESLGEKIVRVSVQDGQVKGSGIYTFDEQGFMKSFTTNDRYMDDGSGKSIATPWTAQMGDYVQQGEYMLPRSLKGTWHTLEGDYTYFDCDQVEIIQH